MKFGYLFQNLRFLLLSSNLAGERLQIDRDFLLTRTSTADELFRGTNIDDLERPWNRKIAGFFWWIFYDFMLRTFKEWIYAKITGNSEVNGIWN